MSFEAYDQRGVSDVAPRMSGAQRQPVTLEGYDDKGRTGAPDKASLAPSTTAPSTLARRALSTGARALMAPVKAGAGLLRNVVDTSGVRALDPDEALDQGESYLRDEPVAATRARRQAGERAYGDWAAAGDVAGELGAAGVQGGALRAAPAVEAEAARAFGGSRASQRGVVYLDDAIAGERLKKLLKAKPTDADVSRIVGHHEALGPEAETVTHISAEGPGIRIDKRSPAMPGFAVERTYQPNPKGGPTITHEVMQVPEPHRGKGIGKALVKSSVETADRVKSPEIRLTAAEDGRAVWPRMGFDLKHPADFATNVRPAYDRFLSERGIDPSTVPAANVRELAMTPEGKAFLNSKHAPLLDMRADMAGESGGALRDYLGVPQRARAKASSSASSKSAPLSVRGSPGSVPSLRDSGVSSVRSSMPDSSMPSLASLKEARADAAASGDYKAFQRAEDEIARLNKPTPSAVPKLAEAQPAEPYRGTPGQSTQDYLRSHPNAKALDEYLRTSSGGIKGTKHERALDNLLHDAQQAGHTQPGETYRGMALSKPELDSMLETGEISSTAPWSTSSDPDVAKSFAMGRSDPKQRTEQVLFRVRGQSGVPVRGAGGSEHLLGEEEVLYRPGRWRVRSSERLPDGRTMVDVEEAH